MCCGRFSWPPPSDWWPAVPGGVDELLAKLLVDLGLAIASYQVQMRWVFRVDRRKGAPSRKRLSGYERPVYSLWPGRRWVVRRALGPWTVQALEETPASAVFLVHHQNLFGPIHAMAFLPREVRLWVLSPFCDRKACFEQYYGYTFTRRFGWPRPAAWAVSRLLSFLLPWLPAAVPGYPRVAGQPGHPGHPSPEPGGFGPGTVPAHLPRPGLCQQRG